MPKNSRRNRMKAIAGEGSISTYGAKLHRWEKEAEKEEATQPNYQNETLAPQEYHILTKISYTKNENGNPGVKITLEEENSMIYSFLAILQGWEASYGVNKNYIRGQREPPIISTSFEGLYNDTWIRENKLARLELQAIEKRFKNTERKSIEDHLGIKI